MTAPTFAASTIDLDDLAVRVHHFAGRCLARSISLEGAARLTPPEWHSRTNAIAITVAQISRELDAVSRGLASTSQAYSDRESFLRGLAHGASSALFWGLGRALGLVAPALFPAVLGGVVAFLAASAFTGRRPEDMMRGLVSSPEFVSGLEFTVSGIDDFTAGLVGLPLPLIATLGERGLGLSGPSAMAGVIVGVAGGVGGLAAAGKPLRETPIAVTRVSVEPATSPQGLEQLIGRIPRADPEMPQVRIERYEGVTGGHPSFVVYLGGTIDTGLVPTDEPWDMTSNVNALAGMDAGSYRAAIAAMRAAGIASDDLVTLVGHSQGGLLAARIAQSPEFRVGDVVTVGAPIHQIPVGPGVSLTAVEHTEDLVPTLGGLALVGLGAAAVAAGSGTGGAGAGAGTTTTVRRSALAGITPSADDSLPGHNLTRYVETGRVMDDSDDRQISQLRARLENATRGAGQVSFWRAERADRAER